MIRAPAFWSNVRPDWRAYLLAPVGAIYGRIVARRMERLGVHASAPVICVGNATAGGAGKTPTAIALAKLLAARGEHPAFLTRGYGGRLPGPIRVDPRHHGPADVGDEPLLLAAAAPVVVAIDRPAGAGLATGHGASVIVMDDGLQNPSLVKDLAFLVVDGEAGFGNGLVMPAGPLRAPLKLQAPFIDAVVLIGRPSDATSAALARLGKPVHRANLVPEPQAAAGLRGQRVLAFAGIGRPEKFAATLREAGAQVVELRAFPDHHPYTDEEIATLLADAERGGLTLVTTSKDHVRLAGHAQANRIATLPVTLMFEDEAAILALLDAALALRRN